MKTRILYFITGVIVFILLLFHQKAGINFFLYGIFMVVSSYLYYPQTHLYRNIIAGGLLISTASIAMYGAGANVLVSLVLFCLLPVFQHQKSGFLLLSPLQSGLNYLLSVTQLPNFFKDWGGLKFSKSWLKFLAYYIIPLTILSIFLIIYSFINVQFKDFFTNIQFKDFDPQFIIIALLALIYSFGFWYYYNWIKEEFTQPYTQNNIKDTKIPETETTQIELNSGKILFIILNMALLVLLYLEGGELFSTQQLLPNELSENVHLSIGAVIISILFAMALIAIYLKGKLNFMKGSAGLKYTIYVWIFLNFLLLMVTFCKNNFYIESLGLTEKRLGVIAFLFLSAIGLIVTFYKVRNHKSTYFLCNQMSWIVLLFIILILPINWSAIITQHNIKLYKEKGKALDIQYLETLNYNHRELIELEKQEPQLFRKNNSWYVSQNQRFEDFSRLNNCENFLSQNIYNYYTAYQLKQK